MNPALLCAAFAVFVIESSGRDVTSSALQLPVAEGAAHGFPAMRDRHGRRLADGEFSQKPEGDRLRARLAYDFGAGHRIEENTLLRQMPALDQGAKRETDAAPQRPNSR